MYTQKIVLGSSFNKNNYKNNSISFSGKNSVIKAVLPQKMKYIESRIQDVNLRIAQGDMTKIKADAFVVPHFNEEASYEGVGGAVARAGALKGIDAFADFLVKNGKQRHGKSVITPSGGGNSDKLIHVVSLDSEKNDFEVVHKSVYNALKQAQTKGVKSVVVPALGTGIIGELTGEQSAKAILSATDKFAKDGGNLDVTLAIYSPREYSDFAKVLHSKTYEGATPEVGKRKFDGQRYIDARNIDLALNVSLGVKPRYKQ